MSPVSKRGRANLPLRSEFWSASALRPRAAGLHGVDERLSTVEATEIWNRMPARQKRRYRTVDSLAAALILERYLQEHRS